MGEDEDRERRGSGGRDRGPAEEEPKAMKIPKISAVARAWMSFGLSLAVAVTGFVLGWLFPDLWLMPGGSVPVLGLIGAIAIIWNMGSVLTLITVALFRRKGRPESEGIMIGRLYRLVSVFLIILAVAHGFGKLGTFGTLFSLFGGMILGWSLQAPVSGFAAWVLVSIKRPFRPGDRIQFPSLGLTGDVKDIGPMYVTLDQVGGTVGSEESVGRFILVPNAMLFSQVVINYTVRQEAAYMLDEVVVRITYNSDMEAAERILLDAARKVTGDIIKATGMEPYIRSDLYDYGVYMRLRYQTHVPDRALIAYQINKEIIKAIQRTPTVDLAIPFIYSFRAGVAEMDRKESDAAANRCAEEVRQIEISAVRNKAEASVDPRDVEQLARSIAVNGLLQPIIVMRASGQDGYEILSGHLRFEACKSLGWRSIPAIVRTLEPSGAPKQDDAGDAGDPVASP